MVMRRRPLLRTAVVGGGAYMAGKSAERRRAEQEYGYGGQGQQAAMAAPQPAAAYPAPPLPSESVAEQQAPGPSMLDQLDRLADLHKQGALTDEEFASAKAKLLGT